MAAQDYKWVARNERGEWCGHWHLRLGRACKCARSWERYYRTKYNERQEWRIEMIHAEPTVTDVTRNKRG